MKKLSRLTMPLAAFLVLTPFALAQQQNQAAVQGDQDKLVQIVRNATKQYANNVRAEDVGAIRAQ